MKIDFKSALLGIIATLALIAVIGAGINSNPAGRYRLSSSGTYFLLVDTQTGKVWTANFTAAHMQRATDGDFFNAKD